MAKDVEFKTVENEDIKIVETKKKFGSKLVNGVKKYKTIIAGVAVTVVCGYAAYKFGVKVGSKSVDITPVVDAVSDADVSDVIENVVQTTEF